ncbi:MAG: site-2 protease family protein [Planctomycetota bacterium]
MPFADPSPTSYDLNFRLFGIPVRIHPFFWLIAVLLGQSTPAPADLAVWVVAVLVSIVVHELGHALLQRFWGGRPSIVLYGFGGLAMAPGVRLTPWRQIAISLAGPAAGFLLAGVTWLVDPLVGADPRAVFLFVRFLLVINIFWGVFNLLPIYPLDGGQVSRELFTMVMRPDRGIVVSLWVSIVCCGVAAAWLFQATGSLWNTVLLIALAVNNYQTLQAYQGSRGGYR